MRIGENGRDPNPCAWTTAVILGVLVGVVEFTPVVLFYRNLPMPDRRLFTVCYGLSLFAIIALTIGFAGSLFSILFGKSRRSAGIAVGTGVAGLVLLLMCLILVLRLAAIGVSEHRLAQLAGLTSTLGIVGIAASIFGAIILGSLGYVISRSRFRKIRYPWLPGLSAAGFVALSFLVRAGDDVSLVPVHIVDHISIDSPLDSEDTNVLLISIDTLRADHLGGFGYGRDTAPRVDELAEQGILFERAITQRTNTAPAMAALLTGTYPPTNRVLNNRQYLQDFNLILAEILRAKGFHTSAVVSNPKVLWRSPGFAGEAGRV